MTARGLVCGVCWLSSDENTHVLLLISPASVHLERAELVCCCQIYATLRELGWQPSPCDIHTHTHTNMCTMEMYKQTHLFLNAIPFQQGVWETLRWRYHSSCNPLLASSFRLSEMVQEQLWAIVSNHAPTNACCLAQLGNILFDHSERPVHMLGHMLTLMAPHHPAWLHDEMY